MKSGKVSVTLKIFVTCILVAIVCMFYAGDNAYADSSKKKSGSSYLGYVKAEVNGTGYTFRGGLKPVGVSADLTWQEFFSNMKVTDYKIITTGSYDENVYTMVAAYIYIDGEWKDLFYYDKQDGLTYYQLEGIELTENYYDVKFRYFRNSRGYGGYSSTGLYARFAKEYKVFYELDGGKFEGESVDTYTAGADYTLTTPVKSGYEFIGWTGTDLNAITKTVVIKNGTTGNKIYTANWNIVKTDDGTTSGEKVEPTTTNQDKVQAPAKTKVKSATKKAASKKAKISIKKVTGAAGYKLQFSTTKKFKKILLTKNVKKDKITVTSKKLKNKKKLYVRVKAYKLDGNTKVWAEKWSKVKKVKIK